MEAFLLGLAPTLGPDWLGISDEEVDRYEEQLGRPLPAFYRWFLGRLGRDMGPLTYRSLDFSLSGIRDAYDGEKVDRDERFLLIGYDRDSVVISHLFYDLDAELRDDALVVSGDFPHEEDVEPGFETLREMIAWGALLTRGIRKHPQRCSALLVDPDSEGDVRAHLDPLLESFGFEAPVATGRHCGVFRGPDMDLVGKSAPGKPPRLHMINVGATDTGMLRRLLGEIVDKTPLEMEIDEWDPPLP